MSAPTEEDLGRQSITTLLRKQAIPASIGILFMTVNILVDTIFVGRWIGSIGIAALTVIMPIAFLIAAIGLAIGIGGSSVLSRAYGASDLDLSRRTFAHQILMTGVLSILLVSAGYFFQDEVLILFGAKGEILEPAREFFLPILLAAPLQAFCAMGNTVIRAEDRAKVAMSATIVAAVGNIVLDILFIKVFEWGIFGAALATACSFLMCFVFVAYFFIFNSKLRLQWSDFSPRTALISEITALSFTTFSRHGVISILAVLLNHTLFTHGGEHAVTVYGIISRMLMFALFPVIGIAQGFLPIAGYNYGAENFGRVKETIKISIKWAGIFAIGIYTLILIFAEQIVGAFTTDPDVLRDTPTALRWVFAASPVIAIQLIGAGYFQAAGKALKALMLTLSKQGFFLIPLILILPNYFGIFGVWVSFPIADILATVVTGFFLKNEMNKFSKPDGIL
ncbi:MAG: MATE family efflux transporter [Flavobacterium sp.]|nr:MATE family efflux transporter [Flavobacterium sp.]